MKSKDCKLLCYAVVVAVLVNLILPQIVVRLANEKQRTGQAKDMNFWDQTVSMLVHHAHTPLTSSIIVAVIVAISVAVAQRV